MLAAREKLSAFLASRLRWDVNRFKSDEKLCSHADWFPQPITVALLQSKEV